jgi:hypothetical protein
MFAVESTAMAIAETTLCTGAAKIDLPAGSNFAT